MRILIVFLFICFLACKTDREENAEYDERFPDHEMAFDKKKWKTKDGADYPYRDKMIDDVVYNDTIRALDKDEILDLLGEPDRINENHLYYMIAQKRLGFWPLHTKTLVIKLSDDNSVDWIKVHE